MFLKKFLIKIIDKNSYQNLKNLERKQKNLKLFNLNFSKEIEKIINKIKSQKKLNFLHSGHAGDIINVLPVIKELSKTHECNLFIRTEKPLSNYYKHPANGFYLNSKMFNMLKPLLDSQSYINSVDKFNKKQNIDINLDLIRELPINLLIDNVRYASILTGVHPNYNLSFLDVEPHSTIKNKIVIQRTFRYRNEFINYKFMSDFNDLLFIGTKDEFFDLKKDVSNLEYYDCLDFLEMSKIIKSSRFVIANSSVVFPIAEGLMVPRLLESCPSFPAAQPHGPNGYNFYFQRNFEEIFKLLNQPNNN